MIYFCTECGEEITSGETDVLKHAEKYGHINFVDENTNIYNPYQDDEL